MVRELQESRFIKEGCKEHPFLLLFWSMIVISAIIVIYAIDYSANNLMNSQQQLSPFLRVTNREFSLFLWQNPHLMRVHQKNKIGYLPGFQYLHKVNMEMAFSEEYVIVPPETLFLYHTWKRLIYPYISNRAILLNEFKDFLEKLEEWQPKNWPSVNKAYEDFVNNIHHESRQNLETLSFEELPLEVRYAFYGWKNYFKEGDAINAFNVTKGHLKAFLEKYPHYAKNYWQNVLYKDFPDYLNSISNINLDDETIIPRVEIPPFLRVAIYNETLTNPSS